MFIVSDFTEKRNRIMAQEVYFTADTHFNHVGILGVRPRFCTVEAMNEWIIERWNAVVRKGDRVYHLGDFALGRPQDAASILARLNGEKYLIRGNHDNAACHKLVAPRFIWIRDYDFLTYSEQGMALCHYAFKTWNKAHYGAWNLHGHSHGSLRADPHALQMDVGVDCNDWTPVNFETIKQKMASKRFVPVDHHRPQVAAIYPWEQGSDGEDQV